MSAHQFTGEWKTGKCTKCGRTGIVCELNLCTICTPEGTSWMLKAIREDRKKAALALSVPSQTTN
jgi:hypothetical protein